MLRNLNRSLALAIATIILLSAVPFSQAGTCNGMTVGQLTSLNGFVPFPSNNLVGNSEGLVVKCPRPKIGMKNYSRTNEVNVVCRIRINRRGRNIGIPQVVGWKRHKAVEARELANGHSVASSGLRKWDCA